MSSARMVHKIIHILRFRQDQTTSNNRHVQAREHRRRQRRTEKSPPAESCPAQNSINLLKFFSSERVRYHVLMVSAASYLCTKQYNMMPNINISRRAKYYTITALLRSPRTKMKLEAHFVEHKILYAELERFQ